jgi:hypothetical protein
MPSSNATFPCHSWGRPIILFGSVDVFHFVCTRQLQGGLNTEPKNSAPFAGRSKNLHCLGRGERETHGRHRNLRITVGITCSLQCFCCRTSWCTSEMTWWVISALHILANGNLEEAAPMLCVRIAREVVSPLGSNTWDCVWAMLTGVTGQWTRDWSNWGYGAAVALQRCPLFQLGALPCDGKGIILFLLAKSWSCQLPGEICFLGWDPWCLLEDARQSP